MTAKKKEKKEIDIQKSIYFIFQMQACISKSHLFGLMPLHSFEYVVERRHYSELLRGADVWSSLLHWLCSGSVIFLKGIDMQ